MGMGQWVLVYCHFAGNMKMAFRWPTHELIIMHKVGIQTQNAYTPFKIVYFNLNLDRTSIEHRRPLNNVHSLLPSTHRVTKGTISNGAISESFRAEIWNTPTCPPTLPIRYLSSICSCFRVKWRKPPAFDTRFVDSFVFDWDGEAHADPEWPGWLLKIAQRSVLAISNWKRDSPIKSTSESGNMSTHIEIPPAKPDQRTAYFKRQAPPDGRTYVD